MRISALTQLADACCMRQIRWNSRVSSRCCCKGAAPLSETAEQPTPSAPKQEQDQAGKHEEQAEAEGMKDEKPKEGGEVEENFKEQVGRVDASLEGQ